MSHLNFHASFRKFFLLTVVLHGLKGDKASVFREGEAYSHNIRRPPYAIFLYHLVPFEQSGKTKAAE
jgi:hypothetical protein